jgi:hypothetical protein
LDGPVSDRVLYLLGCAAPPVLDVAGVVRSAQAAGWRVCLGLTPTAARWLQAEVPALAELTGAPVRHAYKLPGEPDVWPAADAILVAPATANTLNAWALGLTSTWVVGVAAEAIGRGIPLVTMPCANAAVVRHPQFARSVDVLRGAGVRVLYGPDGFRPNPPGTGTPPDYPWDLALATVTGMMGR